MPHRLKSARRHGRGFAPASLILASLALAAGLLLAVPAAAQQGQPQPETQTFQDWTLACLQQQGRRDCRMVQTVPNDQGQAMMQAAVLLVGEGQPGLLLSLPLGVWLPEGVRFRIDGGQEVAAPYARCVAQPASCRVEIQMNADLVNALRAGTAVTITFFGPDQQARSARISLLGFTAAYNALAGG